VNDAARRAGCCQKSPGGAQECSPAS